LNDLLRGIPKKIYFTRSKSKKYFTGEKTENDLYYRGKAPLTLNLFTIY